MSTEVNFYWSSGEDDPFCRYQSASSLTAPVTAQWIDEWSGHGDKDGSYAWAQQDGLPFTKADLTVATTKCPDCNRD